MASYAFTFTYDLDQELAWAPGSFRDVVVDHNVRLMHQRVIEGYELPTDSVLDDALSVDVESVEPGMPTWLIMDKEDDSEGAADSTDLGEDAAARDVDIDCAETVMDMEEEEDGNECEEAVVDEELAVEVANEEEVTVDEEVAFEEAAAFDDDVADVELPVAKSPASTSSGASPLFEDVLDVTPATSPEAGPVDGVGTLGELSACTTTSESVTHHRTLRPRATRSYKEESEDDCDDDGDDLQPGPSSRTVRCNKRRRLNEAGACVTGSQPVVEAKGKTTTDGKSNGVAASYETLDKAGLLVYPERDPIDVVIQCRKGTCTDAHVLSSLDVITVITLFSTHVEDKKNDHIQLCVVHGCSEEMTYTSLLRHLFKEHLEMKIKCPFGCTRVSRSRRADKARSKSPTLFVRLEHYRKHLQEKHKCRELLPPRLKHKE
ncbi:hypothetical protein C8T65DRAFT_827588 [Cerioporus squamosus]|nr:hypothetical protein C8T65DRAFT_827588 [Cerioporus squamosus]